MWIPDTFFGEERHIIVDNVKVVTISAGAKAPASSSRSAKGRIRPSGEKVFRALGASVKTHAATPQCCSAAFGDDIRSGS